MTTEVGDASRIAFLDVLRGVALFGILLVNVFSFGADYPAWSGITDQLAWQIKHVLFETKFWMLYSLLCFWMVFTSIATTVRLGFNASRHRIKTSSRIWFS